MDLFGRQDDPGRRITSGAQQIEFDSGPLGAGLQNAPVLGTIAATVRSSRGQ